MGSSDIDVNSIPEYSRPIVRAMKEIVNCSEQEIYAMLVECNMNADEAITRLLSQEMGSSAIEVNAIPEYTRAIVRSMKEIVNCSEQEIYAMLVECNMNADEAITRLLSQDSFQEVKSKRDKKKEAKDALEIQRLSGRNQYHKSKNGSDQNGGNKLNSYGTSNVQRIRNHLAGSSLNSAISNVETKRVPTSSEEAVPSLSVPSSTLVTALGCGTSASSKQSVTKAPVKDDCLLPEKPVAPNPFSNSFNEPAARRDQLQESPSVSNQIFRNGGSHLLRDNYNNKNDETNQVQRSSCENNRTKDPSVPVNSDQCNSDLQNLKFGRFGSGEVHMIMNNQSLALPSQFLNDPADDLSFRHLNLRDEEEEQQPRMNVANEKMAYEVNSNAARNYNSSPNCDHTEPTQENQYTSSSATDFTFYNSQLFNPVMAPAERSLQMPNLNTFPDSMHQQAFTREHVNAWYSASPLNQSMYAASSLGRRLPVSMTEMNRQAMNHHLYPQPNVPSEHYGNMMNYPYSLPTQNDNTYDMPASAFQQHGGLNNDAYHLRPLVAPLPLHRDSYPCPPTLAAGPYTRSSAYGSANGPAYDSAYGCGMLSDHNTANLRFDDEDDFHTRFSNHLASLQHQNGTSSMWTPPGLNESGSSYYRLYSGPQNQQSESFRRSQQDLL
ncbi:putative GBF-interacting protein [Arabidopsis thaliana]|uniref:GBF-interacting protein 1 N-terminal domain-containing protein n=3 Tax=Arabidopsis TaxID=3701 RepID=A0A178UD53_ARATH|nr:UBA-like superfamily [Arabidopsis thaliana x Arabidopsis arenosa]OAO91550.1 hypothetical protein AXX17_AT5G44840 [Arabidopsis thaliana]CAA0407973.1 unnamed protein product [Arabidopsis thaliana]